MPEAAFRVNRALTKLFRNQQGAGSIEMEGKKVSIEIGREIGRGLYSVAFDARITQGGVRRRLILQLLRLLGPNDQLPFKRRNITAESENLRLLEEAEVAGALHAKTGARLRHIEYVGPRENNEPVFWEKNPLQYKADTFVAFRLSAALPGVALTSLHARRADDAYLQKLGSHLGSVLAEFHFNAKSVLLPHHVDEVAMARSDHAYRMLIKAPELAETWARENPSHAIHVTIAKALNHQLVPLFKAGALQTTNIHGDLGLGNILSKAGLIAGLVDWDKARKGPAEYDLVGVSAIPGLFKATVAAYDARMTELTGRPFALDQGLALKLALAERLVRANLSDKDLDALPMGKNTSIGEKRARSVVAAGVILNQLADVNSEYTTLAQGFEHQLRQARAKYKGIDLRIA